MSSYTGALFRFLMVSTIFLLNFITLVNLLFKHKAKRCIHTFAYGFTIIIVNAYLSTWIPYLFSSFYHSTAWPLLDVKTHCGIQHLVTIQVSTLLLAILCLQKLFETFASKRAKLMSFILFFTWILPQTLYSIISEVMSSGENDNLYFVDSLSKKESHELGPDIPTNQGVLFCIHQLDSAVINHMTWHYVVLVVPLTSLFIICTGAKRFAKTSVLDTQANVNCDCNTDVVSAVSLYTNFIWLLFIRPLLSLFALLHGDIRNPVIELESNEINRFHLSPSIQSVSLDLGTHLILLFISILLPFSKYYGLFSRSQNSAKTIDLATRVIPANLFYRSYL